jgi:hypothetical protein
MREKSAGDAGIFRTNGERGSDEVRNLNEATRSGHEPQEGTRYQRNDWSSVVKIILFFVLGFLQSDNFTLTFSYLTLDSFRYKMCGNWLNSAVLTPPPFVVLMFSFSSHTFSDTDVHAWDFIFRSAAEIKGKTPTSLGPLLLPPYCSYASSTSTADTDSIQLEIRTVLNWRYGQCSTGDTDSVKLEIRAVLNWRYGQY